MATTKLRITKVKLKNLVTKEMGYSTRVITNGTASLDEIAATACRNTTLHKAEAKIALELCMEAVAEQLKQGYIVDLGPVGKLYPSCSSSWVATADELSLENVKPTLYFHAADEVAGAIKGASLQWAKAADDPNQAPQGGTTEGGDEPSGGGNSNTDPNTPTEDIPGEDRP
jgi:hypothetical protein